jgi:hypothetical protein
MGKKIWLRQLEKFLCLRRLNGFAVSMPTAFNFVEGFAVQWLTPFLSF